MGNITSMTDNEGAIYYPYGLNVNWAQNAQYDAADRLTSFQYFTGGAGTPDTKTMTYNVNGQLTSIAWAGNFSPNAGITYSYPAAGSNNGQITGVTDTLSGETISYQYDALKRLTSAASTPVHGSTPAAWTQTYQYDGFGNLTGKSLSGGTNTMPGVNAATNQLTNASYDANGNMTSGLGATFTYDEANRMVESQMVGGGVEYGGYSPENKLVYMLRSSAYGWGEGFVLYGVMGERVGSFVALGGEWPDGSLALAQGETDVWFEGKLICQGVCSYGATANTYQDRVGTNRSNGTSGYPWTNGARFYPYGEEITSTTNDREKFATYQRDSYTGLDYADQRYYASTYGRFNTPDVGSSVRLRDPSRSWNRYAYTRGDPINRSDPRGLADVDDSISSGFQAVLSNGNDGGDGGGGLAGGYLDDFYPDDGPVIASVTATGCSNPGEVYTGGPNGTCDQPIGGPYVGALQQVGNDANGIYQMVGIVAAGSALGGIAAGGIAAGTAAETVPSVLYGDIQASFNFGASVQVTTEGTVASRVFGPTGVAGQSQMIGSWLTPETYTSSLQAISQLALGAYNQATQVVEATIPAGVTTVIGTAGPQSSQPGGGFQTFVQQTGCVVFRVPCALH